MTIPAIQQLENLLLDLRGERVLLDADVARIYGVETRDINKSVANNPEKFPSGYVIELNAEEKRGLVENFHRFAMLKHSAVLPKAFTEKGLYMLATILRSEPATRATLAIIETYAKFRELSRHVQALAATPGKEQQKNLMQRSGELIAELLDEDLQTSDSETSIEINFAVLKFRHAVKRKLKT